MALLVGEEVAGLLAEPPASAQVLPASKIPEVALVRIESSEAVLAFYSQAWKEYQSIVDAARKRGLNHYLYTPLDPVELALASPWVDGSVLLAAKYASVLASMSDKAHSRPSPRKAVNRRSLLRSPLQAIMEYLPAPILLDPSICGSWRYCTACLEACPHRALEGKPPTVDTSKCTGCGVCASACPFGLLFMPKFNIKAFSYMIDRVRSATQEPGAVVVVCDSLLEGLAEALQPLSSKGLAGPVLIIPVACPGWFTEFHMLLSAAEGFDVFMACDDARIEKCSDGGASEKWLREMEPLGAYPGILRSPQELAAALSSWSPRSRPVKGVESPVNDKTSAYKILASYNVGEAEFSSPIVGYPLVDDDKCLVCDACSNMCPFEAIRIVNEGSERRLVFQAENCTACGACEAACPYGALRLLYKFDSSILGRPHVLARDEVARCKRCGRPIGSMKHLKMLERKLRESGVDEWVIEQLWLCQKCKVRSLIEREFVKERGN